MRRVRVQIFATALHLGIAATDKGGRPRCLAAPGPTPAACRATTSPTCRRPRKWRKPPTVASGTRAAKWRRRRCASRQTQAEFNYAAHFLAGGGVLGSAAAAHRTDFSVTGSTEATFVQLEATTPVKVAIEMPEHLVADFDYAATDGALYIVGDAKLNVCCTREGAGVNGTYVTTHVGAGSMYLRDVLAAAGRATVRCPSSTARSAPTRPSSASPTSCSSCATRQGPSSTASRKSASAARAKAQSSARAPRPRLTRTRGRAGERRYEHVQYPHARTLTKTVARVPVGLNDSGYTIVPYVVDQVFPFGAKVLNGLLERAIGIETRPAEGNGALQPDYKERELQRPTVEAFLEATCKPGVKAAEQAPVVATALSDIANFLHALPRRRPHGAAADGLNFDAIESWLRTTPRRWDEANDRDWLGAARRVDDAARRQDGRADRRWRRAEREAWIAAHPYVWALRNVLHPHYTYGVAVVGAAAAEASNLAPKDADGPPQPAQLAGHAIALMIPTVQLLHALYDGSQQRIAARPSPRMRFETHGKRFDAVYPTNVRAELEDAEEGEWLATTPVTFDTRPGEQPEAYAETRRRLKGAADAGRRGHDAGGEHAAGRGGADAIAAGVQLDNCAFATAALNIGRSRKVLSSAARAACTASTTTLSSRPPRRPPVVPERAAPRRVRGVGQIVFAPPSSADAFDDNAMTRRRAARRPCQPQYAAVPLVALGAESTTALDHAARARRSTCSRPGRRRARAQRRRGGAARRERRTPARPERRVCGRAATATRSHILSYATLVHNPNAIKHFCRQIAKASTEAHAESQPSTVWRRARRRTLRPRRRRATLWWCARVPV